MVLVGPGGRNNIGMTKVLRVWALLPLFCKILRIMVLADLCRQMPHSKLLRRLVPLNHELAGRFLLAWTSESARSWFFVLGDDGMTWLWIARADVTY